MNEWQRDWPKSKRSPRMEREAAERAKRVRDQREELEYNAWVRRQPWTPEPR